MSLLSRFLNFIRKSERILVSLLLLLFFLIIRNDPFFGDGISTISRASFHILDSGFTDFTYPDGQDPGHPTLFPAIYALLWTIFGKSLFVSHLFNILFAFGTLQIMYLWLRKTEYPDAALPATLLALLTPLFLAQSAMINTHLPLMFLTLWLAYSLYFHQRKTALVAAALLPLCHLQGIFYLGGIVLWWFFIHFKNRPVSFRIRKSIKLLIIPILLFAGWLAYHYSVKSWLMSAPSSDFYGRGYGGLKISITNWIVTFWRIIDYGQIAYFIPIIILFFGKKLFKKPPVFFTLFLVLFIVNSLGLSFTTTLRTAHRYFLPTLPFLIMASIYWVYQYRKGAWLICMVLLLFSGHFWVYPGRTMGDATLAYRNCYPLLEEIYEATEQESLYTYSPFSDANEYAYLNNVPLRLESLYDQNYKEQRCVVMGNVSGDFSPEIIQDLNENWYGTTYEKGLVYFNLYYNPAFFEKPENMQLRTASRFERWFKQLKKRLRAE